MTRAPANLSSLSSPLRLLSLLGMIACGGSESAGTAWELVGAYDATATLEAGNVDLAGYVWQPAPGMRDSCGPAKGPLGMGIFESEAIGNGLTPTLALILHYGGPGRPEPLTANQLQLALVDPEALEDPDRRYALEPAVQPRRLALAVRGDESSEQVRQLIKTQLSIELCLEHKVGRAWLGSDAERVRQAFMLDRPGSSAADPLGEDRRFFVGQRDPVPALLGPPDACFVTDGRETRRSRNDGSAGAASPKLVASDIWGASLRSCTSRDPKRPETALEKPQLLSLVSTTPWGRLLFEPPPARHLAVDVTRDAAGYDVFNLSEVQLGENGEEVLVPLLDGEQRLFPKADTNTGSTDLTDVLALLPHTYPLVRDGSSPLDDPEKPGTGWYTVLLVPDWQIVQGITWLESGTAPTRSSGPRNGVAWLLEHPEYLSVQVAPEGAAETGDATDWPDLLATAIGREWKGLRDWGYTVGLLHGRKPVFLPAAATPPSWQVAELAQRSAFQGGFLVGLAALAMVLGAGIRRLKDLWTPVPQERADYWPGVGLDEQMPTEVAGGAPGSSFNSPNVV